MNRVSLIIEPESASVGMPRNPGPGLAAHFHGWLFNRMREWDSAVTEWVHQARVKPFTIGARPVPGKTAPGGAWLDFTALLDVLAPFVRTLAELDNLRVELGGPVYRLRVSEVRDLPGWRELLDTPVAREMISFRFVSPTSFRRQGLQVVFPLPVNVFGSLVQRWNALAPYPMPDLPEVWDRLPVTRHRLTTDVVRHGKYSIIGFTGLVTYLVPRETPEAIRAQLAVLARFAEVAGVGYGTTKGLGTTDLVHLR